jgi:hypothetical protein
MGLTNFPNGVTSFGMPMVPGPGIVPNIPATSSKSGTTGIYFVDGTNGNDGFEGTSPTRAFKTLDRAYNSCLGGANEVIYILGGDTSVNFSSSIASGGAGLVWSKNYTHCIGLAAPIMIGQRARITNGASTVLLTPMINVSGHGCLFQNLEIANVGNDATGAAVPLLVTGVRNAFMNCQISGGFTATTAGNAAMRSLVLGASTPTAADENYFYHCYIGLDTIARSSTQTEIEILGASARVVFEDCIISTYTSAGTNFWVSIGANGIDRFCEFKNCTFMNATTLAGGVALADGMSLNASCGGVVLLKNALIMGATATAATKTDLYFDNINGSTTTAKALVAGW